MMYMAVNHPTYLRILKLLDTTAGREKLMRTLQYWSRFLAYYLYQKGYSRQAVTFWKTLQQQLTFARKLFRVGKPLSHLKLAVAAFFNQTTDPVLRYTSVGRQLGYMGYMALDTVMWINQAKLKSFSNAPRIQGVAQKFWLAGLAFGLANSARRYQRAKVQQNALESEDEKDLETAKRVDMEIYAAEKQFLWDLLDSSIPLSALKWVNLDDGFVGLCGLVTSVWGLESVW